MDTRNLPSEMIKQLYMQECNNESNCCNNISNYTCSQDFKGNEQKNEAFQIDHGERINTVNSQISNKFTNNQYPKHLPGKECKSHINLDSSYNKEQKSKKSKSKIWPETQQLLQFTQKMLKDQELLISSMSQQGIDEVLVRRHFDRLLEEQTKQLRLMGDYKTIDQQKFNNNVINCQNDSIYQNNEPKKWINLDPTICNKEEKRCNYSNNLIQKMDNNNSSYNFQNSTNSLKAEQEESYINKNKDENTTCSKSLENKCLYKVKPSSLLKLRFKKEIVNGEKRNNGLQEDDIAIKIIQKSKSKYNQDKKVPLNNEESQECFKLNGTHDKSEMQKIQVMFAPETLKTFEKRPSQNGLENIKNLNNPQWAQKYFKCYDQQLINERSRILYLPNNSPSFNQYTLHISNSSNDENTKENSTYIQRNQDEGLLNQVENQTFSNNIHVEKQSPVQYNYNLPQHWADLLEPKVFGGLTYLARKPQFFPTIIDEYKNQAYVNQSDSRN